MTEDTSLIGFVGAVWVALAALYAFVPLFQMPGSAQVWGAGALIFVALAVVIAVVEAKARRHLAQETPPSAAPGT